MLKVKAARGVLWTLLEYGGGESISLLVFLILARIIAPSDFGLISLALLFVGFFQLFLLQGFADAVIQRETLEEDHCSTAFWANIGLATLFLLLLLAGADLAAAFFHEPRLAPVLRTLSPLPLGTALISIHQAIFRRRLEFASFAKRAVIGIGLGGIAGVAMALSGFGVWSLVGQQLTNAVASVVVIWWSCDWRPAWRFSPRCFRDMAGFSRDVIGSNLVAFLGKRADVTIIGYFFDTHELGYYYLVQRLLITMGLVTQSTIQSIVMPVLSRLQGDLPRFREIFSRAVQLLNAVWLPLALGSGLVASLLLPAIFGEKWRPGVPLLEIMCLCGFTDAFYLYSAPTLAALGRPRPILRLAALQVVIAVGLEYLGTRWGLAGVAAAFVATAIALIPFHLATLRREAGIQPAALLRRAAPASLAAIVMAAIVLALKPLLVPLLPAAVALALLVLLGAIGYLVALALLDAPLLREIGGLVGAALGRPSVPGTGIKDAA